uniref:G_PROTEIN_RECEP_F1_2 domain-containing protein n=1 Tax=Steinernema glaseri TaxID=37863 RepID=A0A1I7Y0I4_9BILA
MGNAHYHPTGVSPEVRMITASYRLIFAVSLTPIYVRLIASLSTREKFRSNMAYVLVINIGICDILLLLSMAWAGVISYKEHTIGYYNLQFVTKCATYMLWPAITIIFPILLEVVEGTESEYDYDFATFLSVGFMVDVVIRYIEISLYAGILLCYAFIIASLVFKRKKLNQKLKFSSPEGRLAAQTVLLFIPQGISFGLTNLTQGQYTFLMDAMCNFPEYVIFTSVLHDLLPFSFLAVLITFNMDIRKFFPVPCVSKKAVHVFVSPQSAVSNAPSQSGWTKQ